MPLDRVECFGGGRRDGETLLPNHDRAFVTVRGNTYACHCLSEVPQSIHASIEGFYFREPCNPQTARWYALDAVSPEQIQ